MVTIGKTTFRVSAVKQMGYRLFAKTYRDILKGYDLKESWKKITAHEEAEKPIEANAEADNDSAESGVFEGGDTERDN